MRYDIYERAITFEGEEFHSTSRQIYSKELKTHMEDMINQLVLHIERASMNKLSINRMVLQFKQSKNDSLWLIRACSVRCANGLINSPVNIDSEIHLPDTVNAYKFSLNPQTAMALQKTVLCRNCLQPMEADRMCEISYRMIIAVTPSLKRPKLLKKIHTQMNKAEYEKFKHNPLFLSKQTLVCDVCFLLYSSESRASGTATRPQTMQNVRILPLDPSKTSKRREITNSSIIEKFSMSKSTKNLNEGKEMGLPRINTALQLNSQKSLAKMLGLNDITAFLEERYANRKLITR